LVVNVATVDGLATAHTVLKQLAGGSVVEVRQVWIARGIDQLDRVRFEAANPTFVLSASKTGIIED
jgi:precorrin-6Y C5,15-methyltransferase (decarboxylating)